MEPAGVGWAGITPIVIKGSNFSTDVKVYLGNKSASIKSVTSTQITVIAPLDTGSFPIKVVNPNAFLTANIAQYSLADFRKNVASLIDTSGINALEVDANETIYMHQSSRVYTLAQGGGQVLLGGTPDVQIATNLKRNVDGYLYMTGRAKTRMYRQSLTTGVEEEYARFTGGSVDYFDFGSDGKTVYGGGRRNLSIVSQTGTVTKTTYYATDSIRALRVYNGFVYVGIRTGISRNQINADGTLGAVEQYFNWQNIAPADTSKINDITFDEKGNLYVATTNSDPILIVHPDKTFEFLYPGALDSPVLNFMWGMNNSSYAAYLYLNYSLPGAKRVGRIVMDENLAPLNIKPIKCAPYYGRGGY